MDDETNNLKNDLEKLKRSAQEIINKLDDIWPYSESGKSVMDLPYSSNTRSVRDDEDEEPTSKEKKILKFVSKNPGCSKKKVEVNMPFSRPIAFKNMKNLIKDRKIISEKGIDDAREYKLFINEENSLAVLIKKLQAFEESYFDLIKKTEGKNFDIILDEFNANKSMEIDLIPIKRFSDPHVVAAIFTPFKILVHVFQFTLLFNNKKFPKKHNSFFKSLLYDTFNEISNKLTASSVIKKMCKDKEIIHFHYFSTVDDVPKAIQEMLKVMKICELDKEVENVLDNLWSICFSYLPYLHPFFSRFSDKELKDWKKIMIDFDSSIYAQERFGIRPYNLRNS